MADAVLVYPSAVALYVSREEAVHVLRWALRRGYRTLPFLSAILVDPVYVSGARDMDEGARVLLAEWRLAGCPR